MVAGELKRWHLTMKRRPLPAVTGAVALALLFFLIAWPWPALPGHGPLFVGQPRVTSVLVAFWIAAFTATGACAAQFATETRLGLLEPWFLGARPVVRLLEMRALARLVPGSLFGGGLVVASCACTGWRPSAAALMSVLVCLGACEVTTLGLILALIGAGLMMKRTRLLLWPVNVLALWAFLGVPAHFPEPEGLALLLPYASASSALRRAIECDAISPGRWALAWAVGYGCLVGGRRMLEAGAIACRRTGRLRACRTSTSGDPA